LSKISALAIFNFLSKANQNNQNWFKFEKNFHYFKRKTATGQQHQYTQRLVTETNTKGFSKKFNNGVLEQGY